MFKGTSKNIQRRIVNITTRSEQGKKLRKLDKIADSKPTKQVAAKLKSFEEGVANRMANLKRKAELRAVADPEKAKKRAAKYAAKQARRMSKVEVVKVKR